MNKNIVQFIIVLSLVSLNISGRAIIRSGNSSSFLNISDLPSQEQAIKIIRTLAPKDKLTSLDVDDFYKAKIALQLLHDPFISTEEFKKAIEHIKAIIKSLFGDIPEPTLEAPEAPGAPDAPAPPPPPGPALPPFKSPGSPKPPTPVARSPLTEEELDHLTTDEKVQSDQALQNLFINLAKYQLVKFETYKNEFTTNFKKLWTSKEFKPHGIILEEALKICDNFFKKSLTFNNNEAFNKLLADFQSKKALVTELVDSFTFLAYDKNTFRTVVEPYMNELILCIATSQRKPQDISEVEKYSSDELLTNALKDSPSLEALEKKVSLLRINLNYKLPHSLRAERSSPTEVPPVKLGSPQIPLLDVLRTTDLSLLKQSVLLTSLRLSLFFGDDFEEKIKSNKAENDSLLLLIEHRIKSIERAKHITSLDKVIEYITSQLSTAKDIKELRAFIQNLKDNTKLEEFKEGLEQLSAEIKKDEPDTPFIIKMLGLFFDKDTLPEALENKVTTIIESYTKTFGLDKKILETWDEINKKYNDQFEKTRSSNRDTYQAAQGGKKLTDEESGTISLQTALEVNGLYYFYNYFKDLFKDEKPPSAEVKNLFAQMRSITCTSKNLQTALKNVVTTADAKKKIANDETRFNKLIFSYGVFVEIVQRINALASAKKDNQGELLSILSGLTSLFKYLQTGKMANASKGEFFRTETDIEKSLHEYVKSFLPDGIRTAQLLGKLSSITTLLENKNYLGAIEELDHIIQEGMLKAPKAALLPFEGKEEYEKNLATYNTEITTLKNNVVRASLIQIIQELNSFNLGTYDPLTANQPPSTISPEVKRRNAQIYSNIQNAKLLEPFFNLFNPLEIRMKSQIPLSVVASGLKSEQLENLPTQFQQGLTTLFKDPSINISYTTSDKIKEIKEITTALMSYIDSIKTRLQYLIQKK